MRKVFLTIFFLTILLSFAHSPRTDREPDNLPSWIQDLLDEQDKSINKKDCIFYFTGHHGAIWSLITMDSSRIDLYNGTTRHYISRERSSGIDTLSFLKNNNETILWGFDSLVNDVELLKPVYKEIYSPIYNELYIIKDKKTVFCLDDAESFIGEDNTKFNSKLKRLIYLMYWMASPSCRDYLPEPCDIMIEE